jgi:cleavage and polyadenylation specificity factor subunit 1
MNAALRSTYRLTGVYKELVYPKIQPIASDTLKTSRVGRLDLVAQYKLSGTVTSMGVVRTSSERGKEGCHSLLLAFSDAKVRLADFKETFQINII